MSPYVRIALMSCHNSRYANAGATPGRLEHESEKKKKFTFYGSNNGPHIHERRPHMARQLLNAKQSTGLGPPAWSISRLG
jgi:hypothetical protein